jgi:2-dehydropantoate 2-reductase
VLQKGRSWYINHVIVTTRPAVTISALLDIKDRLTQNSTICFFGEGMGLTDEVSAKVFPDPKTRPQYIIGACTFNIRKQQGQVFGAIQQDGGKVSLSEPYRDMRSYMPSIYHGISQVSGATSGSQRLVQDIELPSDEQTTDIHLSGLAPSDSNTPSAASSALMSTILESQAARPGTVMLLRGQIKDLAIKAVIGPLSVILDCTDGQLDHNHYVRMLARQILEEIVAVAHKMPELAGNEEAGKISRHISVGVLEKALKRAFVSRGGEINEMLQDVRIGQQTSINYLNGLIVKRGGELGVDCPVNRSMVLAVKAKASIMGKNRENYTPFLKV